MMQEHCYALYVFTVRIMVEWNRPPPYLSILKIYPTPGEGPRLYPLFLHQNDRKGCVQGQLLNHLA